MSLWEPRQFQPVASEEPPMVEAKPEWLDRRPWLPVLLNNAHRIFVVYAVFICTYLVVATPPFQTPDAIAHFFRAIQVSNGGIIGERLDANTAGGLIDNNAQSYAHCFDFLRSHSDAKITAEELAACNRIQWGSKSSLAAFPGSAAYPFWNYIPQALAIWTSRFFHSTIYLSYLLACFFNAAVAVLLTYLAIKVAVKTKVLLFWTALLPMALSLFASVSQDATLIPSCFLIVALVDRGIAERTPLSARATISFLLLILLAASGRPPYIGLVLLVFLPGLRIFGEGAYYGFQRRLGYASLVVASTVAMLLIADHYASSNVGPPHSVTGQLSFLLNNPFSILEMANVTISTLGQVYTESFIGILGWLDTPMPSVYYSASWYVFAAVAVFSMFASTAHGSSRDTIISFFAVFLTSSLIFLALYLYWTPVGETGAIAGVQGRYFIPFFPLIGLLLPSPSKNSALLSGHLKYPLLVMALAIFIYPAITYTELINVVISRYYYAQGASSRIDFFSAPTAASGNQPLVLQPGQAAIGTVPAGVVSEAATVNAFGVLQGNYTNTASGQLTVTVCSAAQCASGTADLAQSQDNSVFYVPLATALQVAANTPVRYLISHDGGETPVALWAFPARDQATAQDLSGPAGAMPEMALQLHFAWQRPSRSR